MALKTLILRPISATTGTAASSAKSTVSIYPSGTPEDQYHILLSEEVADNDSTYIMVKKSYHIDIKFDSIPQDVQIKNVKIMVTAKSSSTSVRTPLTYEFYRTVGENTQMIDSLNTNVYLSDIGSAYTQFECKSALFTQELAADPTLDYTFRFQSTSDGTSVYVTQVYAEITYEENKEPDYVTVYIHENNAWNPTLCHVFQKIDGTWKAKNNDVFVNNEYFNLNLIN